MSLASGSDGTPGRAPSSGVSEGRSGKPGRYRPTVMGTFIHIAPADSPTSCDLMRGYQSDPEPVADPPKHSLPPYITRNLEFFDDIPSGDDDGQKQDPNRDEESESEHGAEPGTAAGGQGETHRASRGGRRPCKSARLRYARLVARLENAIVKDPEGFHFGDQELPKQVRTNATLTGKLATRLSRFQAAERQKRAQASLEQSSAPSLGGQPLDGQPI
uniref:Uncharacterized protein n=1 Tax=Pyrodinium bahamense TaxID=73915 RepID=A0A7S0A800_9DINO